MTAVGLASDLPKVGFASAGTLGAVGAPLSPPHPIRKIGNKRKLRVLSTVIGISGWSATVLSTHPN